jgi:AraC-like DNA-binding protein
MTESGSAISRGTNRSLFEAGRAELRVRRLVRGHGYVIDDVRCSATRGTWGDQEQAAGYALVLPRTGCFHRSSNGDEAVVDATVAYFREPGEEQRIAHPCDGGDRCTTIGLGPAFLAALWGGDPGGSAGQIFSTSSLDFAHRSLLAECRAARPDDELEELIINITSAALEQRDERRVASGRPATAVLRRRLVDNARSSLAEDPTRKLSELAAELAVSPHHLSRIFSAATGSSVTAYRTRLRTRAALERILDGEQSLARLAADLDFADHAHLTRTIQRETGLTPSAVRLAWGAVTD